VKVNKCKSKECSNTLNGQQVREMYEVAGLNRRQISTRLEIPIDQVNGILVGCRRASNMNSLHVDTNAEPTLWAMFYSINESYLKTANLFGVRRDDVWEALNS